MKMAQFTEGSKEWQGLGHTLKVKPRGVLGGLMVLEYSKDVG